MSTVQARIGGARPFIPVVRPDMNKFTDLEKAVVTAPQALWRRAELTEEIYGLAYRQFHTYLTGSADKGGLGLTDDLRHFTAERVQGFIVYMARRGVNANTIRNKLSALSTLAKLGQQLRNGRGRPFVAEDPTRQVTWPKTERRESKYLYAHELKALWEAPCSPALAIAREVLIDTGARVSSLVNAKVGDVRVIASHAYLRLTVKGGREEVVPLSPPAATKLHESLLRRELTDKDDDRPLLVRETGDAWTRTALSEAIVRLAKAAGITRFRVSAHKLRHTNNVFGRSAGLDEFTRAKLLTHSSTATLKVYDHEIPGELARARAIQRQHMEAETGKSTSPEVMGSGYDMGRDEWSEIGGFA